jgi:hypothetical protein
MEVSGQLSLWTICLLENRHDNRWIGGCVGPLSGMDAVTKRKIPASAGNQNWIIQPVVNRYIDWGIPVQSCICVITWKGMRWVGYVARRNIVVGRPRRKWEDNIKINLKESMYEGEDIKLSQIESSDISKRLMNLRFS